MSVTENPDGDTQTTEGTTFPAQLIEPDHIKEAETQEVIHRDNSLDLEFAANDSLVSLVNFLNLHLDEERRIHEGILKLELILSELQTNEDTDQESYDLLNRTSLESSLKANKLHLQRIAKTINELSLKYQSEIIFKNGKYMIAEQ